MRKLIRYCTLFLSCSVYSTGALASDEIWVDMQYSKPGHLIRTVWNDNPIGILHRDKNMIDSLRTKYKAMEKEEDSNNMSSLYRSIKPEHFVIIDRAPNSQCKLEYVRDTGLIDSCTNEIFDFSGRAKSGAKLEIPPHKYVSETKILFGGFK